MYGYIYETTCKVNGKKYIGLHKWSENGLDENYLGSGVILHNAIEKYGKDSFTCRIIECCDTREELAEREKFWIDYYNAVSSPEYYNISVGGIGGSHGDDFIQPVTEKMLAALEYGRHLPASEKQRSQLSKRRKGIQVTEETRNKLRQASLSKSSNALGRIWIYDGVIHKRVLPEELQSYLDSGWIQEGPKQVRKQESIERYRKASSDRVHINKDGKNKAVPKDKVDKYIQNGWEIGWIYRKKFND